MAEKPKQTTAQRALAGAGYIPPAPAQAGQSNPVRPMGNDLASLAQQLGVTLGGGVAEDDPLVYTGGVWDSDAWGRRWLEVRGRKDPLSKVQSYFYMLEPDELKRFQEDAFKAGFYGKTATREDIPWGDFDEDTFKIWSTLAMRSANFLKAGQQKTVWDVLADAVKNAPAGSQAGREREPLVMRLTNPDDIRVIINKAASMVTGGKVGLDDEQTEALINEIHEAERAAQRQVYEGMGSGLPGGPGGEVKEVGDIGEQARRRLFDQNPKEARSYSYIESFNTFMNLLRSSG